MAFSIISYTGDGSTDSFSVPFPYIEQEHVIVSVDDQAVGYEFTSTNQITFADAPPDASQVIIQRRTPADGLIALIQGRSTLKSSELNLIYTQLLYIIQETTDIADSVGGNTVEVAAALAQMNAILAQVETIGSAIAYQYDLVVSVPFTPANGSTIMLAPMVRDLLIEQSATGSLATAGVAPTTDAIISIQKNGSEVGTITFLAGQTTGTFAVPSEVTLVAGDEVSLVTTSNGQSLNNLGITLTLRRTA